MEATTVGVQMVEEFHRSHACAECVRFLEVLVPNFIEMANEFGGCTFGSFKGGLFMDKNSMFGFLTGMDNQGCVGRIAGS